MKSDTPVAELWGRDSAYVGTVRPTTQVKRLKVTVWYAQLRQVRQLTAGS